MKPWQFTLLIFLIISMVVISDSVYKAILQKNQPNQNTISGLLPYYSMPVGIKSTNQTAKIESTFIDQLDLKLSNLKSNSNYSLEFSPDSKQLLVKKYNLDSNFNQQNNQIAQIDVSNRSIVNSFSEKNQDKFFDKQNNLIDLNKTFYPDESLNKGLVLSQNGEGVWDFQTEKTNRGSVWQIYSSPLYLPKRNWLILHLYDPIEILSKHQIKVYNLDTKKLVYDLEVKPFKDLKTNIGEDFIYTSDSVRFDSDFINMATGKLVNIDNGSYILSSNLVDINGQFRYVTSSTKDLQIKNSGKYIPLGESVRNLKVWSIQDKSLVDKIEVADEELSDIEATSDARFLITASNSEKIHFIDLVSKKETLTLIPSQNVDIKNNTPSFKIALSPDQKTLVGVGQDGKLKFWQVKG